MFSTSSLYRADIAAPMAVSFCGSLPANPHPFLADATNQATWLISRAAQQQIAGFLASDGKTIPDANAALKLLLPMPVTATVFEDLIEIVRQRAQVRATDQENLNLLALAGALLFLASVPPHRIRAAIEHKRSESRRLLDGIHELTMIPAFFASQGLAVLYPEAECFSPLQRRWLVERSTDYEERGPAIE